MWTQRFGGDSGVLGKSLTLNNTPRRIVGVMPPDFRFPDGGADYWLPLRLAPEDRANKDQYYLQPIGRLKPGATIAQAQAEMSVIAARLKRDWPVYNADLRIVIYPVLETVVSGVRTQLFVLMAAVAFVLMIACANLGNLLMARAAARHRELAVRQALGAGRRRIAQQLLTESLVLSMIGAGVGLLVGKGFLALIPAAQVTLDLPRLADISIDWRVTTFTAAIGLLAGLFFGTFPIWELGRARFDALRAGSRSITGGRGTRDVLVVSQLALAMILLTGAGLLIKSFQRLQNVDPGFSAPQDHLLALSTSGDSMFYRQVQQRISALPGVTSVALINQRPIIGRGGGAWFNRMDRPLPAGRTPDGEVYRIVSPEIFSTLGLRIQRGRPFDRTDSRANPVVIVNAALAQKHYPGEDALGKKIYLGAPDNRVIDNATIIGIADDTRDAGMAADPLPIVYISTADQWFTNFDIVIRAERSAGALAGPVRAIIREVNPQATVRAVQTMDEVVSVSFAPARWSTILVSVFALVALLVSLVGIFGVLSFIVTQRTKELGIRLALGASGARVQRLVVGRALALATGGLAVGTIGAVFLTKAMTSLLFEVKPADPATMCIVGALLLSMALLASYVPARRATRIDPLAALRAD
jgi:predicted permease